MCRDWIRHCRVLLAGSLLGCAAQSGRPVSNCSAQLSSVKEQNLTAPQSGLQASEGSASVGLGLQVLRGFFEASWNVEGEVGSKRCVMSLMPEEGDGASVKIFTAAHCLPDISNSHKGSFQFKLFVAHRNGFIPLEVDSPQYAKAVTLSTLVNKWVMPNLSADGNHFWTPENGTNSCKAATALFKAESLSNHKTACFSRQDFRLIDGRVIEKNEKNLKFYSEALAELNRITGAALSFLPDALRSDYVVLGTTVSVDLRRRRNLRSMAYLSNVQFCTAVVSQESPHPSDSDTKVLCEISPEQRDGFFRLTTSEAEYQQINGIRLDSSTLLSELRDKHFGCILSPLSGTEDATGCGVEIAAKAAFEKWVKNAESSFAQLAETEKNGLQFSDYFSIATVNSNSGSAPSVVSQRVFGNTERVSSDLADSHSVYLFDYDPAKGVFNFEKGDSGSSLNIFSGYPVAVLSTIDGEPTSGGSSILPLPEPQEDEPTAGPPVATCR